MDRQPTSIVYMVKNEYPFDKTMDGCDVNIEVTFSDGPKKYQYITLQLEYHIPVPTHVTYLSLFPSPFF